MLLINKQLTSQRFIVTAKERTSLVSPVYLMKIHSSFTNKDFDLYLGASVSLFPSRYDEFILATNQLPTLEPGKYSYQLFEANLGEEGEVVPVDAVEDGLLSVVDNTFTPEQAVAEQYTFIQEEAEEDDYVVFKPSAE